MIEKTKAIMVTIVVAMMVAALTTPIIHGDNSINDAEVIQGYWVESYDEQAEGLTGEVSFKALASGGSVSDNPNANGTFQRQDDNYGPFSYSGTSTEVGWEPSNPTTGEDVYFISETHNGSYVWATWREANGQNLADPQSDLMAQYEQIPQPNATAVGENYIEITVESPDYTDYSVDRSQSVNGTYDLFDSYAVYRSDDNGSTWQYLNNTQSVSGTYDSPIQPDYTDAQAVNPDNVTTGENRLVADGLNPNTDYEFKVRMNLDFGGIEGGYNGGEGTGVYTTNSSGPSSGPITTDATTGTQGGNELQGYFYESYDGEAKFFDGSNYYGNISVVDYGNPDNIAVNNNTGGWYNGTSLGSFNWKANEGNNTWSQGSPSIGNYTYFVNEVPEGDVSGNASYVWSAHREVEGDFVADPQSNMTGQYEKMPRPVNLTSGSNYVELQVESPDYTDWDENTSTSPGMGTYDEFVSYSVFIRGGSYTDWTYLNNTESMLESEYGGTYDAPLLPGSSTDPSTVTTGMNYLNTSWDTSLVDGQQYEFKVRMNLGSGLYGGYNGGYDNAYTTYGSGARTIIQTNTTYNLNASSTAGGNVTSPGEGTFVYNSSEIVNLEAKSDLGYHFVEWTGENGTIADTKSNQTTIEMLDNYNITAEFALNNYTLNVSSTAGGSVVDPGEGNFTYAHGDIVTLEAVPNTGYHFVEWTGDNGTITDTTLNATDIEMLANYSITAEFAINNYTLNVTSTAGGNVTVPGEGNFTYAHGTTVTLEAVANTGYHFVEWTGDNTTIGDTTANQTNIDMLANYSITAEFAINNYTLDISSTLGGNVTVPGEGTFNYTHGTIVNLEAVPDTGQSFVEWTGDNGTIGDTTANQTTITMEGNYTITAVFDVNTYTLNASSTAGGSVVQPGESTYTYSHGDIVNLEAVANTGYHFVEWTGDNGTITDTTLNATDIEMLNNYTITAEFAINTYTLNVTSTAGGSVVDPGEGNFTYTHGDIVNLEAVANTGYHFVEWTGDNGTIGDQTANATDIEMLANYSITAEFAINTYTLNVTSTAGGSVVDPGEGNFTYNHGDIVTLEAVPNTGYHFVEWTGDNTTIGDTLANQTNIEMLANYSITAEFAINTYTLNVTSTAGGSVVDPGEGNFTYNHGDIVNLEAVANTGYHFVEWTGDNTTIGDTLANQTNIEMLANYSITAEFAINTYTLNVTSTAGGSVVDPGEGNFTYNHGDIVNLEAVANTGYHFVEWTGDNTTIGDTLANQTNIEMLANYSITAEFAINTYTLNVTSTTGGSVVDPGEGNFTYTHGTTVTLEAVANDGYHFVEWTGDNTTIGDTLANQTNINMLGNYSITAQFEQTNLTAPSWIRVIKHESTSDLEVVWENTGAPEYNVYYSTNQYDAFSSWNHLSTVTTTNYTHSGAFGGNNYYIVRAADGAQESANSSMAFSVEKQFTDYDSSGPDRHYVSIPNGLVNHTGDLMASDLVKDIEGDLVTSNNIADVVKWDPSEYGHNETFYFNSTQGQWVDDFVIEPGDGIGIGVKQTFTWHVNATDTDEALSYQADPNNSTRHFTSIPYTLADQNGDGQLTASDLVSDIEGDTQTSQKIFDIVRYDPQIGDYENRYFYDDFSGQWVDDFVIEPGDGIAFGVKESFNWQVDLITPYQGDTNSTFANTNENDMGLMTTDFGSTNVVINYEDIRISGSMQEEIHMQGITNYNLGEIHVDSDKGELIQEE